MRDAIIAFGRLGTTITTIECRNNTSSESNEISDPYLGRLYSMPPISERCIVFIPSSLQKGKGDDDD
jgi:hypothetical protein